MNKPANGKWFEIKSVLGRVESDVTIPGVTAQGLLGLCGAVYAVATSGVTPGSRLDRDLTALEAALSGKVAS